MSAPLPPGRPKVRPLAYAGALLGSASFVLGLVANEDSTQERIHRALPWTDRLCGPWSPAWLLLNLAVAATAIALVNRGVPRGWLRPRLAARLVVWIPASLALTYWILNLSTLLMFCSSGPK